MGKHVVSCQVLPDSAKDKVSWLQIENLSVEERVELNDWQQWFQSSVRRMMGGTAGRQGPARPKLQRMAMAWYLRSLDNAFKSILSQGLEQFTTNEGGASLHRHFLDQTVALPPTLSMVNDQHSVCHGAGYALRGFFNLYQESLFDISHRAHNDILTALKASGPWWESLLLESIHAKVNYGPWLGAAWLSQ